jgi:iron complex transport system substrate-binding protein
VAIVCWCGARKLVAPAKVAARPGWGGLRAVRAGRVYALLEASFGRPGPRLVDGLELLCGLLHPGLLPAGDTALAARRDEVRGL